MNLKKIGIEKPAGLAFSPSTDALIVAANPAVKVAAGPGDLFLLTLFEEPIGSVALATPMSDPLNMAFDSRGNRLVYFASDRDEFVALSTGADHRLKSSNQAITCFRAGQPGLQGVRGLTFDPERGELYILDAAGPQIIGMLPDSRGGFDGAAAERQGGISHIALNSLKGAKLKGLAYNPGNRHLYVFSSVRQKLYELNRQGQIQSVRDLSSLEIGEVQGMVFAPSGDQTDDPRTMSLYIANSGVSSGGQEYAEITELALTQPLQADLSSLEKFSSSVQTIFTSEWSPPSPDPSGIAYLTPSKRLLICDGEVNEIPALFTGINVFETTLFGDLFDTYGTLSFSDEPTGIAYNPVNGHFFISDDERRGVFEIDSGSDGRLGTDDDIVTCFKTSDFGSGDPEGITYDTWQGHLFIADGMNAEIYELAPGANDLFDGVPPGGDDVLSHFDTEILGLQDPEGVEFNPDNGNLYIVSSHTDIIVEATTVGTAVSMLDASFLNTNALAGVAYAPSSTNPSIKSLYIVDRGIDNGRDPNENDGKLYEIVLDPATGLIIPDQIELYANYPNPFNSTTIISYSLPRTGHATVKIYNILGQHIRTLFNDLQTPGSKFLQWDGRNSNNKQVGSGIYIYELRVEGQVLRKKMILSR